MNNFLFYKLKNVFLPYSQFSPLCLSSHLQVYPESVSLIEHLPSFLQGFGLHGSNQHQIILKLGNV